MMVMAADPDCLCQILDVPKLRAGGGAAEVGRELVELGCKAGIFARCRRVSDRLQLLETVEDLGKEPVGHAARRSTASVARSIWLIRESETPKRSPV